LFSVSPPSQHLLTNGLGHLSPPFSNYPVYHVSHVYRVFGFFYLTPLAPFGYVGTLVLERKHSFFGCPGCLFFDPAGFSPKVFQKFDYF